MCVRDVPVLLWQLMIHPRLSQKLHWRSFSVWHWCGLYFGCSWTCRTDRVLQNCCCNFLTLMQWRILDDFFKKNVYLVLTSRKQHMEAKILFYPFSLKTTNKDTALILFERTLQMLFRGLCIKNSVVRWLYRVQQMNLTVIIFFPSPGVQLVPWSECSNNFQRSKLLLPLWQPGCNYGTWWYSKILLVSMFKNEDYVAHDFKVVAVARCHLITVLRWGFSLCACGRWCEYRILELVASKVLESNPWNSCCWHLVCQTKMRLLGLMNYYRGVIWEQEYSVTPEVMSCQSGARDLESSNSSAVRMLPFYMRFPVNYLSSSFTRKWGKSSV